MLESLAPLEADGVLVREAGRILLAAEAHPLSRVVASVFDTYLLSGRGKHSLAV